MYQVLKRQIMIAWCEIGNYNLSLFIQTPNMSWLICQIWVKGETVYIEFLATSVYLAGE